ncbi:MAG: hypothetical protein CUN56_06725 [Phototrophicales bacterium]|nr:MAG: hypothetical protein CUN56_06725 [Phototrophicales bacterium]RMG72135.1 MAG: hypothetical protein D6711_13610 [Chloroflexota bacterium]
MPEIIVSQTINRPVFDVFPMFTQVEKLEQWQPDLQAAHQTDDRLRVGVMVTYVRNTRALGWQLDLNADIVDYVPNRLIGYKGIIGRFPTSGRIEFESSGSSTTVTEIINVRMGFLFGLFSPLVKRALTRRTQNALNNLKMMME